ncbi:cytoplasmic polyadenylation element-binding protein 1 [Aphelenchoides avenae]|nr:cytoplasmic polyadenylation element-binding protein 1 [Aphelenchus avenae]
MREMVITIETGIRKIELKPFVYQNMRCDKCSAAPGTLFCADMACLKYNCQACWKQAHKRPGMSHHRPLSRNREKGSGAGRV